MHQYNKQTVHGKSELAIYDEPHTIRAFQICVALKLAYIADHVLLQLHLEKGRIQIHHQWYHDQLPQVPDLVIHYVLLVQWTNIPES